MKHIKLFENFLIKEGSERTINLDGVKFYHGTVGFEIKDPKQIDPLFRFSPEYKKNQSNPFTKRSHGSSKGGSGMYFGRTPEKHGTEDSMQYFTPQGSNSNNFTKVMYEMTLKPNSKVVVVGSNFYALSVAGYERLRSEGVDVAAESESSSSAINLINPDAVQSWKEVNRWECPYDTILFKYNEETNQNERVEEKRFFDLDEINLYVKKYLGETKEPITYINKGTLESKDIDNLYSILVKRPLTQK
jgi:hypothetical protein